MSYKLLEYMTTPLMSVGGLSAGTSANISAATAAGVASAVSTIPFSSIASGTAAASSLAYQGVTNATNYVYAETAKLDIHPETQKKMLYGAAIVVGAGVTIAAAPVVVNAIGFATGGITSGSTAASMMSAAAKAAGGVTQAGGIIATLQSVGATSTVLGSTGATCVAAATGACMGAGISSATEKLRAKL